MLAQQREVCQEHRQTDKRLNADLFARHSRGDLSHLERVTDGERDESLLDLFWTASSAKTVPQCCLEMPCRRVATLNQCYERFVILTRRLLSNKPKQFSCLSGIVVFVKMIV